MTDIVLAPVMSEKAMALRNAISGFGSLVTLRPETLALIESGLRVQSMVDAATPDLEIAEVITIDSPDMLEEAQSLNGRLATLFAESGAVEAERKALTAPFNDLVKTINVGYNTLRAFGSEKKDALSGKILTYSREQQRLAREAEARAEAERQKKAAEIAAAQREKEQEAARLLAEANAAAAAGNAETAQTLATQASTVMDAGRQETQQASLALMAPTRASGGGSFVKAKGVRKVWKAELTSHELLILHVAERIQAGDKSLMHLIPYDEGAGNRKAASEQMGFNVPGLRGTCDDALSVKKQ